MEKEGFVVVGKIEGQTWSKEDAEKFYSEHNDKPFFDMLVTFMTSGPIVQLCLEKVRQYFGILGRESVRTVLRVKHCYRLQFGDAVKRLRSAVAFFVSSYSKPP